MRQILYHFRHTIISGSLIAFLICANASLNIIRHHSFSDLANISSTSEAPVVQVEPQTLLDSLSTPEETWQPSTDLLIWAVNPGYTVDGSRDVGELIELHRTTDASLLLAGYSLRYTNASGTSTNLLQFAEGSSMAGESLLLRLGRSANSEQSDATYTTTLAMSGGKLELVHNDTVVDTVCWSGKDGCATAFKSTDPTTLVRNSVSGIFEHLTDYTPNFDSKHPSLILPVAPPSEDPSESPTIIPQCRGLEFSEILSYYAEAKAEQFIEFYNPTDHDVDLTSCSIRYKNKTYSLQAKISADNYYAFYPNREENSFTLTKNPTSSNLIELIDIDGSVVDALTYSHGQKKSTSYARFYDANGEELWQLTYSPTPNAANDFQEFRSCPAGKVINIATGNCVKVTSASSATTDCPAGKYRNPLTGRCKNLETSSEPKPCAEGYERNPTTNRCRKITSSNDGAGYALVPTTYADNSTFIALGVVVLIIIAGSIYIILQFRHEIIRALRKVRQRVYHIRKNLVSRGIRLHRHKKP